MGEFWSWVTEIIKSFSGAWSWLTTPLSSELEGVLGIATTPLALITFTGLVAFIGVAIVKWLLI